MYTPTGSKDASSTGMSDTNFGALQRASASAHDTVDEAARKAKPAIDQVAGAVHKVVDKAADAAAPAADWLTHQGESLNAAQKKLVSDTCSYVSAHPLKAVGFALLAGIVISRLTR